ncbi:MAG: hypothetical protein EG823_06885 [Actinobacteria bacterium]|nr:hypothetical protein [Actinomycetota bacterium]
MRKFLTIALVVVVLFGLLVPLTGCQRKVKMKTGEIVICTAGEIVEDNTKEIEVPQSKVGEYGVTTKVITCEVHGDLGALYAQAQDALAAGDLATARERLQTVIDRDPTYRKAKEQADAIDAGQTPAVDPIDDPATPGGDATPEDPAAEPTGPVVSLTKYVPDAINGYAAQGILADMASLSRQYIPTSSTADQLMIEVEQRIDAKAAEAAQAAIATEYPDARQEKTIGGHAVVAGSNGQFAAAVFTDGAVTVIVELHATGASGEGLLNDVFAVVESIAK